MNKKTNEKKSGKSIGIIIAAVLAAIIVIGLVVFNNLNGTGITLRNKVAAESENFKVTGTMYAYYLGTTYQNFYSYLSYLGADTSKSMKEQDCALLSEGTWFDYFVNSTNNNVKSMLANCEYALANGIELDDDDMATIDANIASLENYAKTNGYNTDLYIKAIFGNGVNESDIRKAIEISLLADKASNTFVNNLGITAADEQAYYEENPESFDGVDYYSYTIKHTNTDGSENTTATVMAGTLKNAVSAEDFESAVRALAEASNADADEATIDSTVANTFHRHILKSAVAESVQDFMFGEDAAEGTTFTVEDTENAQETIYFLAKTAYRDETQNRSVRHILFSSDVYEDDTTAKEVYAELEAAGFSVDKWNELAEKYSSDTGSNSNGGLYESIAIGETVSAFENWLFDEERKAGDTGIVESTYGWHIMQYEGETDTQAWNTTANTAIKNAKYSAMNEEYSASVTSNADVINKLDVN